MKNISRNHGIDILRIVAMLGVVFLHVLGHGGILDSSKTPAYFATAWFFEILALPAVNCFALISGYVGYRGEKYYPRLKNIISLSMSVLFYSISICLIFKFCGLASIQKIDILNALIPMTSRQYWFFSSYFGMFLLSPFLNMIVNRSSKKQSMIFLIFISLASVCSTLYDPFLLKGGYCLFWLLLLYCMGAIIKKYDLSSVLSVWKWTLIAFISFLLIWGTKMITFNMRESFLKMLLECVTSYVSPLMLLSAIGWVCSFSKIKFKKINPKIVSFFSTSAFSVYLIHENSYIRDNVISKIHNYVISTNIFTLALFVICTALIIFVICILIDKMRILLFKLVKADKMPEKAESAIEKAVNAIYRKFDSLIS